LYHNLTRIYFVIRYLMRCRYNCGFLFLLAVLSAALAPSPAQYDVSWSSPSADELNDGMPLGNGATVVLAWADVTAGGLSFYVRHPHAQHTDSVQFTLALVTVALSPNPFTTSAYFNQTHHLEDGSVSILAGGTGFDAPDARLRIYVDANSDTVVVTAAAGDGATPLSLNATITSVRSTSENYTNPFDCYVSSYRPDIVGRLSTALAPQGSIQLRHENCVSCGDPDLFTYSIKQQGLEGAFPSPLPPSPLDGRVFGIGLFGSADSSGAPLVSNDAGTALASAQPSPAFTVLLCVRVENVSPRDWESHIGAQMATAAATPEDARRASHAAWWDSFWARSWITLPGADANASLVVAQYARTRFINAAQSRGVKVPIKFNGMLYLNQRGTKGPLDCDARDWGPDNWWQNTRLPYGTMLAAGDYDIMRPVLEWASSFLPIARARTKALMTDVDGVWFTETTNAFGLYQGIMYDGGSAGHCLSRSALPAGYPSWLSVGGWVRWDFQGNALGPEAGIMALDLLLHTGNVSEAARFVPIATGALDFIASFYRNRSSDGKLLVWPAQVLESWWCEWPGWMNCSQNDMPSIAAAAALTSRLLALPSSSGLITPAQRATYEALAKILPGFPLGNGTDGSLVYASASVLSDDGPKHREVPELYMVHPFRLLTVGRAATDPSVDLTIGRSTWRQSLNAQKNIGWYYGGIDASLLGLTNQSWAQLLDRASNSPGARYPAFAPHLQDYMPSADHYANLMTALQFSLMQPGGDADNSLILFPAWPCEIDVSFKLWGAANTTVEVEYAGGKLLSLIVTPPERAKNVILLNCEAERGNGL
jgi:hypothetical protein